VWFSKALARWGCSHRSLPHLGKPHSGCAPGRTYRVTAQADNVYRLNLQDIANLKTRNASGEMVPIGATATFNDTTGPFRVPRYNLFPAAEVQLNLSRGSISASSF
jgi:multidrug efflux pump subunit AcrB